MRGRMLLASGSLALLVQVPAFAQITAWCQVTALQGRTANVEFQTDTLDWTVQHSPDLVTWHNTGFIIPAGRSVRFSFPQPGEEMGFFRLATASGFPDLSETVPVLAGMELAEVTGTFAFASGYLFRPDGSGYNYSIYSDPGLADSFWDIHWSVLDSQPGLVTVQLDYLDGYTDLLHLQFLADGSISGFLTWDQGPGGLAESDSLKLQPKPAVLESGAVPASLASTTWDLALFGDTPHPVTFHNDGTASGPNLLTGSADTWTYTYIPTGRNTATLAVSDSAGSFTRLYLSFFTSGDVAEFYASSAMVPALFGTSDSFGTFTLR